MLRCKPMTLTDDDLLLNRTTTMKKISLITISIVLFSVNMLSLSSLLNVYAQIQGGAATSGPATGGAASGGGGPCYNCTNNYYGGPATSGAAKGGAATSGAAKGGAATSGAAKGGAATSGAATSGPAIVTAVNGTGTLNCIMQNSNYANITFNNTNWEVISPPKYSLYGLITNVSFDNSNFIMQGSEPNDNCGINENSSESKAVTIISSCGNNVPITFKVSDPAMGSVYHRTYVDQNGTFVGNVICSTTATPLSTMSLPSNSTS
jgi:hypothetical protein